MFCHLCITDNSNSPLHATPAADLVTSTAAESLLTFTALVWLKFLVASVKWHINLPNRPPPLELMNFWLCSYLFDGLVFVPLWWTCNCALTSMINFRLCSYLYDGLEVVFLPDELAAVFLPLWWTWGCVLTSLIDLRLCSVVFFCKYCRISAETFNHFSAYSFIRSTIANVAFACKIKPQNKTTRKSISFLIRQCATNT